VLNESQRRDFAVSLYRTVFELANGKKHLSSFAFDVSQHLAKANRDLSLGERDLLVPLESLCLRALIPDNFQSAGALIGNQLSQNIAQALRPYSTIFRAGAQPIYNLRGNFNLSRELTPVSVNWMHPQDTAVASDDTFGILNLSPKRVAGLAVLSKEISMVSEYDVSSFVLDSIAVGLGVAIDLAALQGPGEFGSPLGVFNTNGVGQVTFGGAASYAKVVNFESQITQALGEDGNIRFIAHPNVREKWKTIGRFASGARGLWEDSPENVAGKPAFVTTSCPVNSVVAGDFTKLFVGWWGEGSPLQITVDSYSRKKEGLIELLIQCFADIGIARPQLFVVNADSATQ